MSLFTSRSHTKSAIVKTHAPHARTSFVNFNDKLTQATSILVHVLTKMIDIQRPGEHIWRTGEWYPCLSDTFVLAMCHGFGFMTERKKNFAFWKSSLFDMT